jgi:hypothetical protein
MLRLQREVRNLTDMVERLEGLDVIFPFLLYWNRDVHRDHLFCLLHVFIIILFLPAGGNLSLQKWCEER